MTEQAAPERPQKQITFRERDIAVQFPTPEQLVVFKRTIAKLESDTDGWTGAQVIGAFERVRRIVDTVIVDRADREWVDDMILDGEFDLKDAAEIVLLAVQSFSDESQNRATRRAKVTPAKKATRRKVAP